LAIVDPEYRDDNQPDKNMRKSGSMKHWKGAPKADYFKELFRVSREQIIFGGIYFTEFLPPNNNWFIWYKNNDGLHMSMAEMAWVSIRKNVKVYDFRPHGHNADWHPTGKPVKLYRHLLHTYASNIIGGSVLDTHLGSASSAIACHQMHYSFTGCEIDKVYYEKSCKRFKEQTMQQQLFK
jgi:site-specific DNA-methyltransferase (adenine-specific)